MLLRKSSRAASSSGLVVEGQRNEPFDGCIVEIDHVAVCLTRVCHDRTAWERPMVLSKPDAFPKETPQ